MQVSSSGSSTLFSTNVCLGRCRFVCILVSTAALCSSNGVCALRRCVILGLRTSCYAGFNA